MQATHPGLNKKFQKMSKKVKKTFFDPQFYIVFSLQKLCFFSQEKFNHHSFTHFQRKKKRSPGIKKTTSLTQSRDDSKTLQKLNFSAKKKNGTFAITTFEKVSVKKNVQYKSRKTRDKETLF